MRIIEVIREELSLAEDVGGEFSYELADNRIYVRPYTDEGELLPPIGHITYTNTKDN